MALLVPGGEDKPGIRPERVELATDLAVSKALAYDDAEDDPIGSAIEAVREASPEWFGTSSDDNQNDDKSGKGSTTPPPPGRKGSESDKGSNGQKSEAQTKYENWKASRKRSVPIPSS